MSQSYDLPRLVIAAPGSGHGKTTVAIGLMAALRRAGSVVSGHKIGPDFIDPGYHALATGRPGRNLDPFLVGADRVAPMLLHGALVPEPADVAIIEGVMGLFDGAMGSEGFASTAHVARLVQAPVVLVADASHTSRTIAAVLHGLATFDPTVRVAGVVLNKVASVRHEIELRAAMAQCGIPLLGTLPRDAGVEAPARHLGLVPVAERDGAAAALDRLADRIAEQVDLGTVLELAQQAPPLQAQPWDPAAEVEAVAGRPKIALAGGRAFTFTYTETAELLGALGCEVLPFDPLLDESVPAGAQGLYLGGGFPQTHAGTLVANARMRSSLAAAVRAGLPTVAECAGMLCLAQAIDGAPMAGVLPAQATMRGRLTLGYRTAIASRDTLLTRAGERVHGHEFHRSSLDVSAGDASAWMWDRAEYGWSGPSLHASYLHVHWAGYPSLATRFAQSASEATGWASESYAGPERVPQLAVDRTSLDHHGDREDDPTMLGFAVNVDEEPRPQWLNRALREALDDVGRYPDARPAREAVAARHARPPDEVLLTNGAAEAFHLLAVARPWARPVVVHPQFTEPEAALRAAGHRPERVILAASDGFVLDPQAIPDDADLVVIGNPTNPTGALHDQAVVEALVRPHRLVVVDEAFMDAVPGEPASLAGVSHPGLVVLRSLTKSYAIPGIRAGYVLGSTELVAALAEVQPPWSVNTAALAAALACSSGEGRAHAQRRAAERAADRDRLVAGLRALGLQVFASAAPFVLVRGPVGLRESLRHNGIAVRSCDSFPGLTPDFVRVAVRGEPALGSLLAACERVLADLQRDGGAA